MVDEDYYLKLKAARYYYEDQLTQQEIARRLNVSRPTVVKLLKQAREESIVRIEVVDVKNTNHFINLEKKLKKKYKLKDVKIIDNQGYSQAELNDRLGRAGALYVERLLKDGLKIGVSWGKTLKLLVDYLKSNRNITGLEVVTLVGGSGNLRSEIHSNILSDKILNKYNGQGFYLYAPAIVDSQKVWEVLQTSQEIRMVLDRAKLVDLALVGIGAPVETATLLESGYYKQEEKEQLMNSAAVGNICSRYFDKDGRPCDTEINRRVVGISLEDLRSINNVIVTAGGREKAGAILGALRGNYLDTLISDIVTCKEILELDS